MNKHIVIKEEIHKRFNDLKKEKGMTADGLMTELMNQMEKIGEVK